MPWIKADKKIEDFEGEFWNEEEEKQIEGIVEEVKKGTYNKYFMKIQTKKNIIHHTTTPRPQHTNRNTENQEKRPYKNRIPRRKRHRPTKQYERIPTRKMGRLNQSSSTILNILTFLGTIPGLSSLKK